MMRNFIFLIVLMFIVLFPSGLRAQTEVPGEYILKWKNKTSAILFEKKMQGDMGWIDYHSKSILESTHFLQHVRISPENSMTMEGIWRTNPDVLYFNKNKYLAERTIPDDPSFPQQWQYINNGVGGLLDADLDMDLAWDVTTGGITSGGDTIVVCVIDEGVNLEHPDLMGNLWVNRLEIPGNGIDDDQNGYIDDVRGWNVESDNDDLTQGGSHGTPVCGVVGAKGNNGVGVSGVNWNVKIMFVKYGSATEANALASYGYAYTMRKLYNETQGQKGAFVVVTNASWGINDLFPEDAPLWCEMYDLLGEVGVLSCGATTNRDVNVDISGDLPTTCGSEYLLAVTNMNRFDQKLSGAGYGAKSIDLGAYGHQTYTLSRGAYAAFGGTSGATPHVAGTIALMYAVPCANLDSMVKSDPPGAARMVKDLLLHGTVTNATLTGITTSGGRLNTNNSVQGVLSLCGECALPSGVQFDLSADTLIVTWLNENTPDNVAIRFRKSDKPDWVVHSGISNGFRLRGLDLCTEYEIQIGASCSEQNPVFGYSRFITSGGCCPVPARFETDLIDGNVVLSWDAGLIHPVAYFIQVQDKFGNSWITQADSAQWKIEASDSCSWFSLGIQAFCSELGTESPVVENIIVNTPCGQCTEHEYCSLSRKNTSDEWIQRFEMGSISVESGVNPNGYGNYLGLDIGHFMPDSSYDIRIIPGFSSSPFTEDYSVYADFDQDGFFTAEELIFSAKSSSEEGVSGQVTIPDNAVEGVTRLRVIMAFQNHNSPCDSDEFEYGEWEEYCMKISREKPDCSLQDSLIIDTSGHENVKVYFPALFGADQYAVILEKVGGMQADTFYVDMSPVVLPSLDSCTLYTIRMAPDCGVGNLQFTPEYTFFSPCGTATNWLNKPNFEVFPNPFDQTFQVRFAPHQPPSRVLLSDLTGRRLEDRWQYESGTFRYDASRLPSGVYFITFETRQGRSSARIIKL